MYFPRIIKTSLTILLLCASLALASAEEEGGEKKAKPPEKPRPDSAISSVLQLPVVREWGKAIAAKNNGSYLAAWGETIKEVDDHKCWGIAVGESTKESVRVWRRFCVSQSGIDVWVESIPADITDEIHYTPYDDWVNKCKPTSDTTGTC